MILIALLLAVLSIERGIGGDVVADMYEPNFKEEWCEEAPVDVILVMDSSGSVEHTFNKYKETASRLVRLMPIGEAGTHVTLFQYSKDPHMLLSFSENANAVHEAVDGLQFLGSTTETAQAVTDGVKELQEKGRPDARRLYILMTDGNSNNKWIDVLSAADLVNSIGATVAVVGYGDAVYWPEIEAYAGGNSSAYTEDNVEHLFGLVMDMTGRVCRNTRSPGQCTNPWDIQLVIDSSESVEKSFQFYKQSAVNLVNSLSVGDQAALFSIVQYSREATVRLPFSADQTAQDVLSTLDSLEYIGATTKTADAVDLALRSLVEYERPHVVAKKMLILMTDGHSFDQWEKVEETARNVRLSGVDRVLLAAGETLGQAELEEYAAGGGTLITGGGAHALSTQLSDALGHCDQ